VHLHSRFAGAEELAISGPLPHDYFAARSVSIIRAYASLGNPHEVPRARRALAGLCAQILHLPDLGGGGPFGDLLIACVLVRGVPVRRGQCPV